MLKKNQVLMTQASALALLAFSLIAPSQALAQAQGDGVLTGTPKVTMTGSGDVVVTASRRASTTLATPIDISAVTGADLEKNGIENFQDLSQSIAGLVYNSSGIRDSGPQSFVIHGLNLDAVTNGGDSPSATVPPVSIYVGETPDFVNIHLADIQRIEVLRGPQATLYGDASIAGTVRVLFNEPNLDKSEFSISGDVGGTQHANGPNYSFDAVGNQPITDKLAVRVAAGYTFENGFINAPALYQLDSSGKAVLANPSDPVHSLPVRTSQNDVDNSLLAYVRPMIKYEDGPLKLLATYQHQYEHSDGPDQDGYPGGPAPSAFSTTLDKSKPAFQNNNFDSVFPTTFSKDQSGEFQLQPLTRNVDLGSLEGSYDMGFATLTSVTSASDTTSHAVDDSSASYQHTFGKFYNGWPRMLIPGHRDDKEHAIIQEVRLVSASNGPLTYTVGAFYMDQNTRLVHTDYFPGFTDYLNAAGIPNFGTDVGYVYDRRMDFKDLAGFGELAYKITPAWQITGGVRVFTQTLDLTAINDLPLCGPSCSTDLKNPLGQAEGSEKQTISKALFKFNTSYTFPNKMLAYFTFSQGERRGGASAIPTTGPFGENPAFQFYQPDFVDNYEIGFKGRFTSRFEYSSAIYYVDWHNPEVNVSTPNGGFPATVNGKSAQSYGVDLEAHYLLTQDLRLNATYAYNEAMLTGPIVVGGINYGGNGQPLPGTPHTTASVSADYNKELTNGMLFNARANVSYRSNISTSLTPSSNVDLPGFAMVGATVGLSKDAWRVSLYGENLGNVRGVLAATNLAKTDVRGIDNLLSRPLTVGMRFAYKYN